MLMLPLLVLNCAPATNEPRSLGELAAEFVLLRRRFERHDENEGGEVIEYVDQYRSWMETASKDVETTVCQLSGGTKAARKMGEGCETFFMPAVRLTGSALLFRAQCVRLHLAANGFVAASSLLGNAAL
jgi:hypothetical protein